MSDQVRIVTRGDDLGSARAANRAIMDAFDRGVLRNTSVMVPAPYFDEAAEMFRDLPDMCVGLHITLNCEWESVKWGTVLPPEEVPSVVGPDGCMTRTPMVLHERGASPDEMFAEIEAQLALARDRGLDIRYMDSHMGVTWLGDLEDRVQDLAQREGLVYRPEGFSRLPGVDDAPSDPVQAVLARLAAAEPGTYLLVGHPAYYCAEMRRYSHDGTTGDKVAWERNGQRRIFMDESVVAFYMENDIRPIRYDEI